MKTAMAMLAAMVLVSCSTELPPTDEADSAQVPAQERSQSSTLTGAVWHHLGNESCYDWFGGPCTATAPEPQCPTAVDGAPCPTPGLSCARVRAGWWSFAEFSCE